MVITCNKVECYLIQSSTILTKLLLFTQLETPMCKASSRNINYFVFSSVANLNWFHIKTTFEFEIFRQKNKTQPFPLTMKRSLLSLKYY